MRCHHKINDQIPLKLLLHERRDMFVAVDDRNGNKAEAEGMAHAPRLLHKLL
jgi:hypothetical protein